MQSTDLQSSQMIELNKTRANWRDWLKALLLLGLGIYLAILIATGNLSNYVNLRFQWLTYVAVVIFLLLGAWLTLRLLRGGGLSHTNNAAFVHTPVTYGAMAIIAIPLVLALLVPSRPLGADAVSGGISFNPVGVGTAAEFSRAPLERNILDWLREFTRVGTPAALNGEELDVTGFVYREAGMDETQFLVARFTMSCCVADAFAIGLPVEYAGASALPDDTWVRIRGSFRAGAFAGETRAIVRPDSVEQVEPPANPYLYS